MKHWPKQKSININWKSSSSSFVFPFSPKKFFPFQYVKLHLITLSRHQYVNYLNALVYVSRISQFNKVSRRKQIKSWDVFLFFSFWINLNFRRSMKLTFEWFTPKMWEKLTKRKKTSTNRVYNERRRKSTAVEMKQRDGEERERENHKISQIPHTRVLEIVFWRKKFHTHFHAFIEKNFQGWLRAGEVLKVGNFESSKKAQFESMKGLKAQKSSKSVKEALKSVHVFCARSVEAALNR